MPLPSIRIFFQYVKHQFTRKLDVLNMNNVSRATVTQRDLIVFWMLSGPAICAKHFFRTKYGKWKSLSKPARPPSLSSLSCVLHTATEPPQSPGSLPWLLCSLLFLLYSWIFDPFTFSTPPHFPLLWLSRSFVLISQTEPLQENDFPPRVMTHSHRGRGRVVQEDTWWELHHDGLLQLFILGDCLPFPDAAVSPCLIWCGYIGW